MVAHSEITYKMSQKKEQQLYPPKRSHCESETETGDVDTKIVETLRATYSWLLCRIS